MRPEAQKLLYDVLTAAGEIEEYLRGTSYDDYEDSGLLQAGVERKFEIVGEAVAQLAKLEPDVARKIPEHARVIAFRNVLIHAYSGVSPAILSGTSRARSCRPWRRLWNACCARARAHRRLDALASGARSS